MGDLQAKVIAVAGAILIFLGVGIAAVQGVGFTTLTKIITLVGMGLLLIAALLALGNIVTLLRTRQGRYGLNVITGTLAALGIVVIVNFLGVRYVWRTDLTATGRFELSPQTEQVLSGLADDARIYVLIGKGQAGYQTVMDLVREYDFASPRVSLREVNPYKEPALVERLRVGENDWLAIEVGDRVERLEPREAASEEAVTNAFVRVMRPDRKVIYFLTGHGERSPADQTDPGYFQIARQLELENYRVATFSFAELDSVPGDCAVLVIAGPRSGLSEHEMSRVRKYFERGHSVLMEIDPVVQGDSLATLGVERFLADFGIQLGRGVAFDESPEARQQGGSLGLVRAQGDNRHPVTAGLANAYPWLPRARPVRIEGSRGQWAVLLRTSTRTWEEMDAFRSDVEPEPNPGRDAAGPLPMAVALSEPARDYRPDTGTMADPARRAERPESRLVVIGTSAFAGNRLAGYRPNRDLFLNAVSWLAEESDLVAVRPRSPEERRIRVSAPEKNFIRLASVILYPLGVLVIGVIMWVRRRKRDV